MSKVRARIGWALLFVCVAVSATAITYFFALPQYRSPRSQMYATRLGYPALMRKLGRPIPVEVATAQNRRVTDVISAVGAIQFLNLVPITTEEGGIVVSIPAREGDHVEPGDTLLTVSTGGPEARTAELALDLQLQNYRKARLDYDRDVAALKRGLITQATFDATEVTYRKAEISVKVASETLGLALKSRSEQVANAAALAAPSPVGSRSASMTALATKSVQSDVAPGPGRNGPDRGPDLAAALTGFGERVPILALTGGTVIQLTAYVGQNLTQHSHLMSVGDHLVFAASVDQRYFASVHVGDKAKIYVRALDGTVLEGSVSHINPQISNPRVATPNVATLNKTALPSTYQVYIEFDTPAGRVPPLAQGMDGYCLFNREKERLVIPEAALMRYSGGDGVVAVVEKENRVKVVPVSYSVSTSGWVAITQGLALGDRVILSGQTGLQPGDRVTYQ